MKTKILTLTFILSLIMISAGCDWIDPKINVDPTSPSDAPYSTILPQSQAAIAYTFGGDLYRYTSLFTQHHFGNARQHENMYLYSLQESDLDNAWLNLYVGPMLDLKMMIDKSSAERNYSYAGMAQVLMALCLGQTTDILGDIPYSDALKGNGQLLPKYDTQEQIYTSIQSLLDAAIANFSQAIPGLEPGGDDFIYGGDVVKWKKAAYSLKARYFLHIKDYANALTNIPLGFASNDDDFVFAFADAETQANPFYQFMSQRGDINMGPRLMELMKATKDPRILAFVGITGDTAYSTQYQPNGFYTQINAIVPFMTFSELKFIEAECKLAADKNGAYKAYTDAITANLDMFGVDDTEKQSYFTKPQVGCGANNLTIELLINQKYVALYEQAESWTDWRRTGFPTLTPTAPGKQIPVRMLYPQTERLYNGGNMPAGVTQDDKVWWHKTKW
jgi:hypothetical protein